MNVIADEIGLEEIVGTLVRDKTFSRNGVELSLDDYFKDGNLNPDWIYFLARDIEDNRRTLMVDLEPQHNVSTWRLYKAIPKGNKLKDNTNRPALPYQAYFALVELISNNPGKYIEEEGYIQLAKDVREKTGTAAHLAQIWSGARQYRQQLQWPGEIDLPLNVFDTIDEIVKANPDKYIEEEGYIQLAKDVREKTGTAAHLAQIWSGARQYREQLKWPGKINLPLNVFDTIDEIVKANPDKYIEEEGYIQLAKDVREKTGTAAHLAQIWSGARQYREQLKWHGIIKMPLDAYLQAKAPMPIPVLINNN